MNAQHTKGQSDLTELRAKRDELRRIQEAGPELLEALEKLSEVFAAYVDVETVVNAEIADTWNTARNAIAKAKGEK